MRPLTPLTVCPPFSLLRANYFSFFFIGAQINGGSVSEEAAYSHEPVPSVFFYFYVERAHGRVRSAGFPFIPCLKAERTLAALSFSLFFLSFLSFSFHEREGKEWDLSSIRSSIMDGIVFSLFFDKPVGLENDSRPYLMRNPVAAHPRFFFAAGLSFFSAIFYRPAGRKNRESGQYVMASFSNRWFFCFSLSFLKAVGDGSILFLAARKQLCGHKPGGCFSLFYRRWAQGSVQDNE